MTQIFYAFTAGEGPGFPGAPFLLSAGLMVLCLAVFLTGPGRRRETP
jgi:DHA1 family tetracycline resistance protein-like MFS transporter